MLVAPAGGITGSGFGSTGGPAVGSMREDSDYDDDDDDDDDDHYYHYSCCYCYYCYY